MREAIIKLGVRPGFGAVWLAIGKARHQDEIGPL
jgi:hypothetical protein